MPTPLPFPDLDLSYADEDANPGIQLFGRRFFSDQTIMEYLVEFLLICHSAKSIGKGESKFNSLLPALDQIRNWQPKAELCYTPPVRLALKLFSFLGASKLDTRHRSHSKQYLVILDKLRQAIHTDGTLEKDDVLNGLENLFLGLQGVGSNRTWCAQAFMPLSANLLASEAIWKHSNANRDGVKEWHDSLRYFATTQKLFMARGGELLYLQICNAFRSWGDEFDEFAARFDFTAEERDPKALLISLENNLHRITDHAPPALNAIAELIDGIDGLTAEATNRVDSPIRCGWCPEESWREGYLFAVELNRLCMAAIDPIERIDLLMLGCALHVLRSLCAQSVRYTSMERSQSACGGGLGYAWIISDPEGTERGVKHLSQRNLQIIQKFIQQALRHQDIQENVDKHARKPRDVLYREADKRYGHKLFISLAKKLGLVIPQRGPGARFVFNDKIVRYLVMALLPPGKRRTYDDFRSALYAHFGVALEANELKLATFWSGLPQLHAAGVDSGSWLADMLRASGFLIHLSDACSLVHNPFSKN